jgi:hypothetical protein
MTARARGRSHARRRAAAAVNQQLDQSETHTMSGMRPRNIHTFERAAHDLYIEPTTVLRATAGPAA